MLKMFFFLLSKILNNIINKSAAEEKLIISHKQLRDFLSLQALYS